MYAVSPVQNQISPKQYAAEERRILESALKTTESKTVRCPYCKTVNPTRVEKSFNCCMCIGYCICMSLCIGLLIVLCPQGGSGVSSDCGNVNCDDAKHYCRNCNKLLYEHSAC